MEESRSKERGACLEIPDLDESVLSGAVELLPGQEGLQFEAWQLVLLLMEAKESA